MSYDEVGDVLVLCSFVLLLRFGNDTLQLAIGARTGKVLGVCIVTGLVPILRVIVVCWIHDGSSASARLPVVGQRLVVFVVLFVYSVVGIVGKVNVVSAVNLLPVVSPSASVG